MCWPPDRGKSSSETLNHSSERRRQTGQPHPNSCRLGGTSLLYIALRKGEPRVVLISVPLRKGELRVVLISVPLRKGEPRVVLISVPLRKGEPRVVLISVPLRKGEPRVVLISVDEQTVVGRR